MKIARSETETHFTRIIGQNLRELRKAQRLSGRALAGLVADRGIRMSAAVVCRIENATAYRDTTVSVTVDQLMAFAEVLGVGPLALLGTPKCGTCMDLPPQGFACRACGAES